MQTTRNIFPVAGNYFPLYATAILVHPMGMPSANVSRSNKPIAVQHSVVALHAQGYSIRKIARELRIAPLTVANILRLGQNHAQTNPSVSGVVERIVPRALEVVENAIDKGDSQLAMRYLERTALAERKGTQYNFDGDVTLNQQVTLLAPVQRANDAAIEAAENPPPNDMRLSNPTNFSENRSPALPQPESAVIDVEAEPVPDSGPDAPGDGGS